MVDPALTADNIEIANEEAPVLREGDDGALFQSIDPNSAIVCKPTDPEVARSPIVQEAAGNAPAKKAKRAVRRKRTAVGMTDVSRLAARSSSAEPSAEELDMLITENTQLRGRMRDQLPMENSMLQSLLKRYS